MKYISLLGLVATLASNYPLENIEYIEEYKIAQIAVDLIVEVQDGLILNFKKVSENRAEITPELLDTDFLYAPFILFSFNYKEHRWFAEQTDDINYFKRMLKFKESEPTYKYAIIGAGSIKDTANIRLQIDSIHHTLIAELC